MENEQLEQEILKELQTLNKTYSDELTRQAKERADRSAAETISVEEQKVRDAENAKIEAERHKVVTENLASLAKNIQLETEVLSDDTSEQELLTEIKGMNERMDTLISYQENGADYQLNQQSLGTMTVALLVVGIGAYLLIKLGSFVVSKIIKMIA